MEQLRFGYKIREVAGSPVLTMPRHLLRRLSLSVGDVVTLSVSGNKLVVEAMKPSKSKPTGERKWK